MKRLMIEEIQFLLAFYKSKLKQYIAQYFTILRPESNQRQAKFSGWQPHHRQGFFDWGRIGLNK
jgi:hypothetical protein